MRRLPLHGCCALSLCAASIGAQQVCRTAHPQSTLLNNGGNVAPLGVLATGLGAEARTQILLRPLELPGPGAQLVGLEVHCRNDQVLLYTSFVISASSTTATALTSAFAANTPAPKVLLQATNMPVAYRSATWTTIPFQYPFHHDGRTGIVLDIQKSISPATIASVSMDTPDAPRPDRPAMRYVLGTAGSGAANASTASASGIPIVIRLLWRSAPTMSHRSDIAANGNQYAIGSPVTYTTEGQPGALYLSGFDLSRLATPTTAPGAHGLLWLTVPGNLAVLDAHGRGANVVTIPPQTSLVGMQVTYQAAVLDVAANVWRLTNAHDHFVNP